MAYAQQTWSDNNVSFPVSAARMQHIEAGLGVADANASQALAQSLPQPVVNGQWVKGVGGVPVWAAITPADIAGYPADATKFLRGDGIWAVLALFPPGSMILWPTTVAPTTWVLTDGASYPRTGGTYDALFAQIGTIWGAVDGAHFNVPDLRGRVPVILGTNASVNALAASDGQAVGSRRPHHQTTKALTGGGQTSTESADHTHSGSTGGQSADHSHQSYWAHDTGGFTTPYTYAGGNSVSITGVSSLGASNDHTHAFTTGGRSAAHTHTDPAPGGSIGTNVGSDAVDTPSFAVVNCIIKL